MPNIVNSEIAFLTKLNDKLSAIEGFEDDCNTLSTILNRLNEVYAISKARTAISIAEKRKTNPFYGRSKKEKAVLEEKLRKRKNYKRTKKAV